MGITHRKLCVKAASYLKNKGIVGFNKCTYVVCELERAGESPDAFGFNNITSQLIEVKVSRSDFLSDKRKSFRKIPEFEIGTHRSYLCPSGLIKESDLPEGWGLLWYNDNNKIDVIKKPEAQKCNRGEEVNILTSILRREGIGPKVFSYKKYKTDEK